MKHLYTLLVLGLCISSASAQSNRSRNTPAPLKLSTANDSLQYTIGAYLGQWIINNGFSVNNSDLFMKGLNDALGKQPLMIPPSAVASNLDSYQKRLISARSAQQEQLLFQNVKNQSGVGSLPNGVNYVIMKAGTGMRPQAADSVLIHVKGFLPDGTLFEDTYAKQTPLRGLPTTFIPGLAEVLQIMPAGSTWRVFVPSALGYAERGVPGLIPSSSALIFEVELVNAARNR
jgi:FKBP-type peptidyl-prolyl cis-trans isomerase